MNQKRRAHLELMRRLFAEADRRRLPLWISGGWAIDARLGRVTREHDDIDVAFPAERQSEFLELLQKLGGRVTEETDYGFLAAVGETLVDCEPCHRRGDAYEIEGVPSGSCPDGDEGAIAGFPIRCVSWAAILWDYFHYLDETPQSTWPAKDVDSYRLARAAVGEAEADRLFALFRKGQEA